MNCVNVRQFHVCIEVVLRNYFTGVYEMSRSYDCNTLSANYGNLDSVMQVNRSHFCKKLFDNVYINVLIALSVCKRHVNK